MTVLLKEQSTLFQSINQCLSQDFWTVILWLCNGGFESMSNIGNTGRVQALMMPYSFKARTPSEQNWLCCLCDSGGIPSFSFPCHSQSIMGYHEAMLADSKQVVDSHFLQMCYITWRRSNWKRCGGLHVSQRRCVLCCDWEEVTTCNSQPTTDKSHKNEIRSTTNFRSLTWGSLFNY